MYEFNILLKEIRKEAGLSQKELAEAIGVSKILISMVETGQKPPSKTLIIKLASKMKVSPSAIAPFLYSDPHSIQPQSAFEKELIKMIGYLQKQLVKNKSRNLTNDRRKKISRSTHKK